MVWILLRYSVQRNSIHVSQIFTNQGCCLAITPLCNWRPRCIMSSCALSCRYVPCHAGMCFVMPLCALSCQYVPSHAIMCLVTPLCALSCHYVLLSCHYVLCHVTVDMVHSLLWLLSTQTVQLVWLGCV